MASLNRRKINSKVKKKKSLDNVNQDEIVVRVPAYLDTLDFLLLIVTIASMRIYSAMVAPIPDCDEVYNYWEPMHWLTYGKGLQTWELSSQYALRSYLYVGVFAVWQYLFQWLPLSKIQVFYGMRVTFGVLSAVCESYFLKSVAAKFGKRIFAFCGIFLLFSSGMFLSAQNFLPSTFSMDCVLVCYGAWYSRPSNAHGKAWKYTICIISGAVSVIVGWPFSVVAIFPVAIDTIRHGLFSSVRVAFLISSMLIMLSVLVDSSYYKKFIFTPWNLVSYNKGSGSEKYGVEPWHFYLKNLLLNFNVVFLLSLAAPFVIVLRSMVQRYIYLQWYQTFAYILPYYIWLIFFSSLKHKEERFLVVVYPLLCLSAAVAIEYTFQIFETVISLQTSTKPTRRVVIEKPPERTLFSGSLLYTITIIFVVISLLRSAAVVENYSAPLQIYEDLYQHISNSTYETAYKRVNVCVGKEWYRFPSSYFLPQHNADVRLAFLKSDFDGLLPQYYGDGADASSRFVPFMNDDNLEEMSRYIDYTKCHFIVDLDLEHQTEPHYLEDENFEEIISERFLDAQNTPMIARILAIPGFRNSRAQWGKYYVARRIS